MYIAEFEPINKRHKQFGIKLSDFIEKYNLPAYRNTLNIVLPVYEVHDSVFENTGETMTVYGSNNTYLHLYSHYYNRIVKMYNLTGDDFDFSLCFAMFLTYFNDYMERKSDSWGRIISARAADFSPIANYDKYSDGVLKYKGSEVNAFEPTGTETQTRTEKGSETDTHNRGARQNTVVESATPDTDAVFRDSTKSVENDIAFIDSDTRNFANRQTEEVKSFTNRQDESTKSFVNRQDENTLHEWGNIGVQTTISILKEYTEYYRADIISEILKDFMDEISFY